MYYKYSFWGAFVKENLNLLSDFYNRLIIKSVGDGQKRSGAFRVEKRRFLIEGGLFCQIFYLGEGVKMKRID